MEQLISKYVSNELTPAETTQLVEWLNKDSVNRKVFENIVGQWNLSSNDIEDSKKTVLNRIDQEKNNKLKTPLSRKVNFYSYAYKIAAALVVGLSLSILTWTFINKITDHSEVAQEIFIQKVVERGQKLTFELPDGTIVKLNSGSSLVYPKTFVNNSREVTLIGEAFFDVTRNENKPFRITTGEVQVQVLGTSFNVKAYQDETLIEVAVKTGKVKVSSNDGANQTILEPSDMATYSYGNNSLNKSKIADDQVAFGWADKNLAFNEKSFAEIAVTLERWYDVKIDVIKEVNTTKKFTAFYKNPSLRMVLESLSYAYEFEYEIDENKVIIK